MDSPDRSADLSPLRDRMVTSVTASGRPVSDAVAAAMRAVPRHLFLPDLPPAMAYRNEAIVTRRDADGQPTSSSSQPTIMAYMLDQLGVAAGQRVLEIGAGTGYNAALLQQLVGAGGRVVTVDLDADVAREAAAHLAAAGCPEVTVVQADGAAGLARRGPVRPDHRHGRGQRSRARLAGPARARRADRRPAGPARDPSVRWRWSGMARAGRAVRWCRAGSCACAGRSRGPNAPLVTRDNQELALTLPGGRDLDITAVARALADPAGPAAERATRVTAGPAQLFDGLGLWLALNEPRWGVLSESVRVPGGLARAPAVRGGPADDRRGLRHGGIRRPGPAQRAGLQPGQAPARARLPRARLPGQAPGQARPGPGSTRAAVRFRPSSSACSATARPVAGPGRRAGQLRSRPGRAAGRPGAGDFRISAYPGGPGLGPPGGCRAEPSSSARTPRSSSGPPDIPPALAARMPRRPPCR